MAEEAPSIDETHEPRWIAAERRRQWHEEHEADRNRLVARVSSSLLVVIVMGAMGLVLVAASLYGWLNDKPRAVSLFVAIAGIAVVVCAVFAIRYVVDGLALRRFDRDYPRP